MRFLAEHGPVQMVCQIEHVPPGLVTLRMVTMKVSPTTGEGGSTALRILYLFGRPEPRPIFVAGSPRAKDAVPRGARPGANGLSDRACPARPGNAQDGNYPEGLLGILAFSTSPSFQPRL